MERERAQEPRDRAFVVAFVRPQHRLVRSQRDPQAHRAGDPCEHFVGRARAPVRPRALVAQVPRDIDQLGQRVGAGEVVGGHFRRQHRAVEVLDRGRSPAQPAAARDASTPASADSAGNPSVSASPTIRRAASSAASRRWACTHARTWASSSMSAVARVRAASSISSGLRVASRHSCGSRSDRAAAPACSTTSSSARSNTETSASSSLRRSRRHAISRSSSACGCSCRTCVAAQTSS